MVASGATGAAAAAKRAGGQLHSCSQKLEGAADAACFLQKRGMKPAPKRLFQPHLTFGPSPIHQELSGVVGSGMPVIGSGLQQQWERGRCEL